MNRLKLLLSLFVLVSTTALMAQTVTINGTVTAAEDGLSLPGVAVTVKGTTLGALTDANGRYSLNVPASAQTLTFTFVGMKTVSETISGRTTIDVAMQTDMLGLDEVVVTALGISRDKKALGYSVQDVTGDEIARAKETNIINSLQGRVSGAQITATSGAVGASSRIVIRGISSLSGNNQPLFVVDGIPISNADFGDTGTDGTNKGSGAGELTRMTSRLLLFLKVLMLQHFMDHAPLPE
jgi:hypothetical protein